jgi:hypothetical protein
MYRMNCTKQPDTWNGRLRPRDKSVGQHIRETAKSRRDTELTFRSQAICSAPQTSDTVSDTSSSVSVSPWEGRLRTRLGFEAPVETPRVRYNARYNLRNNVLPCSF